MDKKGSFKCQNCNKIFYCYKRNNRPHLFCSRECYLSSDYYSSIQKRRMAELKKEKNYNWKGTRVSYKGLHRWITKNFGKPSNYQCEFCNGKSGSQTLNWANLNHKYRRDRSDWAVLCKPCHSQYDERHFKVYSLAQKKKNMKNKKGLKT